MTILALEFSSPQRSVAVLSPAAPTPGDPPPALKPVAAGALTEVIATSQRHTMQPLAMVEATLRQAGLEREQVDCIVVGLGPGSYTGIRAALSLAQGWHLARAIRMVGVSTAEAVAVGAAQEGLSGCVTVVIDAQRGEFYLAGYELGTHVGANGHGAGVACEVAPLRLASAADAQARATAGDLLIGPEVTRWFPAGRPVFARAATLARLALGRSEAPPGATLEPIYLRATTFVKAPPARVVAPLA
jgi:tRNA threonylcarbamoyl adenosine modification protein YeaZ